MRGGARWRALSEERVPQKLMLMYGIWLVICGLSAWYLARGSARRRLNNGVFAVLLLIALINVAQLVYVFGFGESIIVRPRNAFEKYLQHTDIVWYILFALWPFAAAIGVAQASLRIWSRPALARWLSFGCSAGIAVLHTAVRVLHDVRARGRMPRMSGTSAVRDLFQNGGELAAQRPIVIRRAETFSSTLCASLPLYFVRSYC